MQKTNCPITNSLKLIGGKWKIAIIYNLMKAPMRFGELKKVLSPITQQMLTKQLRELERDKVINRKVYEVVPPKVEYSLTDMGLSLRPVLDSWCKWGNENQKLMQKIIDQFFSIILAILSRRFPNSGLFSFSSLTVKPSSS